MYPAFSKGILSGGKADDGSPGYPGHGNESQKNPNTSAHDFHSPSFTICILHIILYNIAPNPARDNIPMTAKLWTG